MCSTVYNAYIHRNIEILIPILYFIFNIVYMYSYNKLMASFKAKLKIRFII